MAAATPAAATAIAVAPLAVFITTPTTETATGAKEEMLVIRDPTTKEVMKAVPSLEAIASPERHL
jgi:hypothetical protein